MLPFILLFSSTLLQMLESTGNQINKSEDVYEMG